MNKYYRVLEDDFNALPFYSEEDEGWEGHSLIIDEQNKKEFIAEQVANFTHHLLSIIYEIPMRGEHNPFKNISKKYLRKHEQLGGDYITCPNCKKKISEEEWDSISDNTSPLCPYCEYVFEMENFDNENE